MKDAPKEIVFEPGGEPTALLQIDQGGSAILLSVAGRLDVIVKWYIKEMTPGRGKRLRDALAVGRSPAAAARHPGVCWPLETIEDEDGRLAGCLMQRATYRSVDLVWLSTAEGRERKRLPHEPAVRVGALRDLAAAVGRLHQDYWIVGDLSRRNVLASLWPGRHRSVQIVDSDSFWRADVARSARGGPPDGADGYAAPEILRMGRPPSKLTDRWALAALIFMVLNESRHPLGNRDAGHTLNAAILAGPPPPHAFAGSPEPLARLYRQAFVDGYDEVDAGRRPTAEHWWATLSALL